MNTAQEAVDYVKGVESPNAKNLLDTFHMNIEEDTIASAVENAGSSLGYIHLSSPSSSRLAVYPKMNLYLKLSSSIFLISESEATR